MKHTFKSTNSDREIIVETSAPAKYVIEQIDGISKVTILGGNTYSIDLEPSTDRQQFLRYLTSALRSA